MKDERALYEIEEEELAELQNALMGYLIDWMDDHRVRIRMGSVGTAYNLYTAFQKALDEEWKKSQKHKPRPKLVL